MRGYEDVDGQNELLRLSQLRMGLSALGPVVEGFEDDEEVDVAVGAGVAAGVAAEEDDPLGVEFLGNQLGNGLNCFPVDGDFGHLLETSVANALL